jgi:ectoine hydroxylase-related dioxygenase (phytanoyl-CoA dioxygenase family)
MTPAQREAFERDGYLLVRGALSEPEVACYASALDRVYATRAGTGPMHLLSAVAHCPEAAGLIDHPKTFGLVWSVLGWNVHIYHSHLDVHPKVSGLEPFRFEWHQDGGRQNRELDGDPRPRMSVKLAYWLSDVSAPGRGNLKVVPGSHTWNRIDGPLRRDIEWPDPPGAVEVCARPGDAVFFDRRLWHARSANYSGITRKAIFFGYTLRWVAIRDESAGVLTVAGLSPVRRQLLGEVIAGPGESAGDHRWGHYPASTPLYQFLAEHGRLSQEDHASRR